MTGHLSYNVLLFFGVCLYSAIAPPQNNSMAVSTNLELLEHSAEPFVNYLGEREVQAVKREPMCVP